MKPTERGFAHLRLATQYSVRGLRAAWQHEESFRQEVLLSMLGLPLALWLSRDMTDFLILVCSLLLLLLAELANSAIEAVVDRVGEEHHELSGRAKDLGSAMVFMAILIVLLCWGGVLVSIFYGES